MPKPLPNPPIFEPAHDRFRHKPAEYVRRPGWRGWYQDGRQLRHVKPSKAFIWPKDGKNGSPWGRMKDIFKNEGPDMYVAFGARKTDCVSKHPTRPQWTEHAQLNESDGHFGFNSHKFAPWTRNSMLGGRDHGKSYDFRSRKYAKPSPDMWADAVWQPEPYENSKWHSYPEAFRQWDGGWFQDAQYLPQFLGGHVDNEFGRGMWLQHLPPAHVW